MRGFDLTGPSAKLELALKTLETTCDEINERWHDDTYRRFVETYLSTLPARVRTVLDSINRLNEVLHGAEQQCRDDSGQGG